MWAEDEEDIQQEETRQEGYSALKITPNWCKMKMRRPIVSARCLVPAILL